MQKELLLCLMICCHCLEVLKYVTFELVWLNGV